LKHDLRTLILNLKKFTLLKIFSLGVMFKFSQYISEGAGASSIFNLDPW